MNGVYRDTEDRMRNDAAFHALVMHLAHVAAEHGFTPGELKQAAFAAAVYVEMRDARPMYERMKGREP